MAAKKPGRAGNQGSVEATDTTAADSAADSTRAAGGQSGGAPAKKSRGTKRATGAAAEGAGANTAAGGGAGEETQARTRTARKQAGATGDTQAEAGGTARGRKTAGAGATKSTKGTKSAKGSGAGGGASTQQGESGGTDLQRQLRGFLEHHPHGWQHSDWEGLLGHLREQGIDTSNPEQIGSELEKERVVRTLENSNVSGLGGSKLRSLADRFSSLWNLRHASVDDIADIQGINRSQAEKIHEAVR